MHSTHFFAIFHFALSHLQNLQKLLYWKFLRQFFLFCSGCGSDASFHFSVCTNTVYCQCTHNLILRSVIFYKRQKIQWVAHNRWWPTAGYITLPRRTRRTCSAACQCSTTCLKTVQDLLGNAEIGSLTPPAVLSSRCSFQLLFVSIDGIRHGSLAFPLLCRSQRIDRFVDSLKRQIIFSWWYPTIATKMRKSSV